MIVPTLVITEVVYLLGTRLGPDAEVRFLGDLAVGSVIPEAVAAGDWLRIAELVARYRDLPLGTVDASVVAAADGLRSPRSPPSTAATSASSNRTSARSRSFRDARFVTLGY